MEGEVEACKKVMGSVSWCSAVLYHRYDTKLNSTTVTTRLGMHMFLVLLLANIGSSMMLFIYPQTSCKQLQLCIRKHFEDL